MTVDEIIVDPAAALGLDDGCVPLHIVILCEYARPTADIHPQRNGLSIISDEDSSPWVTIGMLDFARQLELDAVGEAEDEEAG